MKASLTGPGICDFYDDRRLLGPDHFRTLLANFTCDWNHLNVRDQAHEAKITWPVAARALGLK